MRIVTPVEVAAQTGNKYLIERGPDGELFISKKLR